MLASYRIVRHVLFFGKGRGRGSRKSENLFNFGTYFESLREGDQFRHPPEDCQTNAKGVSQAREFLHFTRRFEMFGEIVSTTRVEVTIQKNSHTCHHLKRGVASWLRNCGWVRVPPDPRRTLLGVAATHSSTHGRVTKNL